MKLKINMVGIHSIMIYVHAEMQCVVAELMCGTPNSGASSKKSPSSTACSSTDLVSAV